MRHKLKKKLGKGSNKRNYNGKGTYHLSFQGRFLVAFAVWMLSFASSHCAWACTQCSWRRIR